jgi:hypothetical protein
MSLGVVKVGGINPHNDCIRRLQIQTQTTRTGTENEHLILTLLRTEQLYEICSLLRLRASVQPQELPAHHVEEVGHDVHHLRHLEEDQDAVARSEELWQDASEEFHLAGRADDLFVDDAGGVYFVLDGIEEERVLADFAELHQLVREAFYSLGFPTQKLS